MASAVADLEGLKSAYNLSLHVGMRTGGACLDMEINHREYSDAGVLIQVTGIKSFAVVNIARGLCEQTTTAGNWLLLISIYNSRQD